MYSNGTLPPHPRTSKATRVKKGRAHKPIEEYRTKYGTSGEWICPRCETRPVYLRKNGRWLAPADCCLPCRRAEQALADYWRDVVGLPLAYYNTNMRVTLKPIRRKPVVQRYQSHD